MNTPSNLLTPDQIAEHYDGTDYYIETFGRIPWAVHIIGPDEVHAHVNPDLDDDDPANEEFTQRTALKFAAESNAFMASAPVYDPPIPCHAVVLHHGDPWIPDEIDGPTGQYCEWFDYGELEFFCNQCFRQVPGHLGCPDHAPVDIPGLQVTECSEPGIHPRTFAYADNGGYGAPCMYCVCNSISEAHEGCEHAGHLFWFRWHWLVRVLKRVKVVRSYYYTSSCRCAPVTAWAWTKRGDQ